jgi:hypothetical protein
MSATKDLSTKTAVLTQRQAARIDTTASPPTPHAIDLHVEIENPPLARNLDDTTKRAPKAVLGLSQALKKHPNYQKIREKREREIYLCIFIG